MRELIKEICNKLENKTLVEKFKVCRSYISGEVFDEFCDAMNISHYERKKFEKDCR